MGSIANNSGSLLVAPVFERFRPPFPQDRAQRKAAPSTAESHLRAANARAEEAELKLEEARKQLTHQVRNGCNAR